jgi:competence protein ComEA
MMPRKRFDPPSQPHWLLRRADQAAVAVLVGVGLAAAIGWWIAQGGLRGRLIEVDRAAPQTARFQVDINQAEWPELASVPGVGPTLAHRIVDCRRAGGPFVDHDDLRRRVRGIGPRTLEGMRPYLLPMPPGRALAGK